MQANKLFALCLIAFIGCTVAIDVSEKELSMIEERITNNILAKLETLIEERVQNRLDSYEKRRAGCQFTSNGAGQCILDQENLVIQGGNLIMSDDASFNMIDSESQSNIVVGKGHKLTKTFYSIIGGLNNQVQTTGGFALTNNGKITADGAGLFAGTQNEADEKFSAIIAGSGNCIGCNGNGGGGGNPTVLPTGKGKNNKQKKQNGKGGKNKYFDKRGEHMYGWDEANIYPFQSTTSTGSAIIGSDNSQVAGLQGVVVGGQSNCVGPTCSETTIAKRMLQQGGARKSGNTVVGGTGSSVVGGSGGTVVGGAGNSIVEGSSNTVAGGAGNTVNSTGSGSFRKRACPTCDPLTATSLFGSFGSKAFGSFGTGLGGSSNNIGPDCPYCQFTGGVGNYLGDPTGQNPLPFPNLPSSLLEALGLSDGEFDPDDWEALANFLFGSFNGAASGRFGNGHGGNEFLLDDDSNAFGASGEKPPGFTGLGETVTSAPPPAYDPNGQQGYPGSQTTQKPIPKHFRY